jgi:hypothetical protein
MQSLEHLTQKRSLKYTAAPLIFWFGLLHNSSILLYSNVDGGLTPLSPGDHPDADRYDEDEYIGLKTRGS